MRREELENKGYVPGDVHPDSDPEPGSVEYFYESVRGEIVLWTGTLGPPVLWALHHQSNYALVRWACTTGHVVVLHLVTAAFLLLSAGAGFLSYWNWKQTGACWPVSKDEGIPARTRLLALLGILTSAMFSLVIFAQGIANFVFNPCEH